jgi:hypothetical protein
MSYRPPPAATMPRAADGSALLLPSPLSSSVSPNSAAADPAWVIFRVVYAVIALAGVAGSQAVVWWLLQRGTDARWGHTDRPAWNYLCVGWAVSACFGAPLLVRSGLAQLRQLRGMDLGLQRAEQSRTTYTGALGALMFVMGVLDLVQDGLLAREAFVAGRPFLFFAVLASTAATVVVSLWLGFAIVREAEVATPAASRWMLYAARSLPKPPQLIV